MRRRRLWLGIGVILIVIVTATLIALPPVVRRVATSQLRTLTGRDVAIADVGLNLFTRRLTLVGFRIGDGPSRPPFVEFERLEIRFRILPLLRKHLTVDSLALTRPVVRVVRLGPSEFNFSDLIARLMTGPPSKEPAYVALGHLALTEGAVLFEDRVLDPAKTFEVRGLTADLRDIATVSDAETGRASLSMTLAGAPIRVTAENLRARPAHGRATITVSGLDLSQVALYVPPDAAVRLERGTFATRLEVAYDAKDGVQAGGDAEIADLVLRRPGQADPLVTTPKLSMTSRDVVYRDGTVSAAHLELRGDPSVVDASVSPPQRWDLRHVALLLDDVSYPARTPARVALDVGLPANASLDVRGTATVAPPTADVIVTLVDFDLTLLRRYIPPTTPVGVGGGRLGSKLKLHYAADGIKAGGDVAATNLVVLRPGQPEPFVSQRRLDVSIANLAFNPADRSLGLGRATASGAPSIVDGSVTPARRFAMRALRVVAEEVTWPAKRPLRLTLAADLPEAGSLGARGTVTLDTRRLALALELKDTPITPYLSFVPVAAPLAGRVDAAVTVDGTLGDPVQLGAKGSVTLRAFAVGSGDDPPLRVERVEVSGIDARWPSRVRLERVAITKPAALIVRDKDGSFPLREMLTPKPAAAPPSGASPAAPAAPTAPPRAPPPVIEVGTLAIDDGDIRFIDHGTTPFYSEEISRLALTLRELSTAPDKRTTLALQALVGGGALELAGDLAPFGQPFYLDVQGQLSNFAVPRTNPYVERFLAWFISSGQLSTKLHYRIVGDDLDATNDIVVQRLNVERAKPGAEADRKIGLPLGLAVSILKDSRGDIRLSLPVGGKLSSPQFSLGEIIVSTLRNVLVKMVTAPFRAIGRIFERNEDAGGVAELKVDPVTFPAGSAAVTPEAAEQLQRVADFLRASPYVKLAAQAVVTPEDVASLKSQEIAARMQRIQRDEKLRDLPQAAARAFAQRFPGRPAPKGIEEIVAKLADVEPTPEERVRQLGAGRLDVTRRALVEQAGVEAERIVATDASAPGATGSGRVEFELR